MSGEGIRRVEEILDAALLLPEAERPAYLEEACGGDEALRSEVESLLAVHGRASAWFDRMADDLVAGTLEEIDASLETDRRIGPWRTLERLARGGMGSVLLAERADGAFEQRVALKLIRRGLESDESVERFLVEREILARLEHPNIARLVDGGVTDEGLPWFAMELVDGEPIHRWCAARATSVEERLRLFLEVADAVAYLHRNLVVHRDLKPGNVLVTDDGHVKVVDFGIAKVLDADAEALTRTGSRPRTPRYAAPEQVEGGPVTTATDVYALGVLLYELLAETPVFDAEGHTLERAILETDPAPPSAAAPAGRRRRLKGDLDTIVLTAIRKDPDRRYASAQAMADDVRRHLDGRPVAARPDRFLYRAGKFVRRHTAGVASAAAILAILVGFGIFASIQSSRIAHERDRAREVSELLVDVFSAPDPTVSPGADLTARDLVDRGVDRVRERLADRPLVRAELLSVLGTTYRNLGLFDEAIGLFEEALETRSANLGPDHPDVAASLYDLGEARIETAGYEDARERLRAALRIQESAFGPDALETATTLNDLARVHHFLGESDEALRLHERALAIREAHGDSIAASQSLHNLGGLLRDLDRHEEAIPMLERAVRIRREAFGDLHPRTLTSTNTLAVLLEREGRFSEAETLYRRVVEDRRRLYPDGHPSLSTSLGNLANLLLRVEGNEARAEALHREALEIDRRMLGEEHPMVGQRYHTLARAVHARGRLDEAETLFRRAWEILAAALPEGHVNLAYPMTELGEVLLDQGRAAEAVPVLREALALRVAGFPEGHVRIAEVESALGAALTAVGRTEEAEALLASALRSLRDDPGATELAAEAGARLEALRRGAE